MIVVAVVGNAAEHSTAVIVAMKNKMDLSLNIAIGSSIQIALFVAPVLVFASYLMPGSPMDLHFTPLEVLAVLAATVVANMVSADGIELARGRDADRGHLVLGIGVLLPALTGRRPEAPTRAGLVVAGLFERRRVASIALLSARRARSGTARAAVLLHDRDGVLGRERRPVGPPRAERVVDVRHREGATARGSVRRRPRQ